MATSYTIPADLEARLDALTEPKPRKLIKCASHPNSTLPLKVYNYTTPHGQKKASQNRLISMCRGLVIENGSNMIIARPMESFRNYDVKLVKHLEDKSFSVLEKLDGSLGIWFCYRGQWMLTTRGSFDSTQALEGTKMGKAIELDKGCDPSKTYCFEIIYPSNKLTVDYGDRAELVLLAVIDTLTGEDTPNAELPTIAYQLGVACARSFEGTDVDGLRALDLVNEEGFVIRFNETGERAKVKFQNWYDKQGNFPKAKMPEQEAQKSAKEAKEEIKKMKQEARKRVK
jgi:hypothetical protein